MIPTLLMHLEDGTLDTRTREGIASAVGVGALRFREGGALVEEAGTNYWPDPTYMTSAVWSNSGTATWVRDTAVMFDSIHTSIRAQVTAVAPVGFQASYNTMRMAAGSFFDGQAVTHSFRVRANRAGVRARVYIYPHREDHTSLPRVVSWDWTAPDTAWHQIVSSSDPLTGGVSYLRIYLYIYTDSALNQVGDTVWYCIPQAEKLLAPTTPIPEIDANGNLLPGYAWTGAAHNSASTRAAASVLAPCPLPGWVAVRYSEDFGATWHTVYRESMGAIGTYGHSSHDGGNLVLASRRATIYGQVMAGNGALTPEQQAKLVDADGDWTWDMFLPRFGGIHVSVPVEPIAVVVTAGEDF